QEYIKTTRRNQKELSHELGIDKTKLSKLLKEKINPSIELCFRLEKHSDTILSAKLWYRLYLKQLEQELVKKDEIRKAEYEQVKGSISLGLTG
ncbi:MAG: helix-turn-helix transcriptional regulator, partial [Bacteroidota bacterium]